MFRENTRVLETCANTALKQERWSGHTAEDLETLHSRILRYLRFDGATVLVSLFYSIPFHLSFCFDWIHSAGTCPR